MGYSSDDSDDSWNSSDSEELGFLTGSHDPQGFDAYDTRPPVRVRAAVARPCHCGETHEIPPGPYVYRYSHHNDHDYLPRHKCESDLAFKIRKCQWKDVRGLLGPRAMAAGGAGVRLAADAPTDTTGKGKGKASAKGGSKQTGASHVEKNTPDFFDLANAISLRAPADVLLALLAVAPSEVLRHRWGAEIKDAQTKNKKTRAAKEREAREADDEPDDFQGCSLLHVAMFCPHETVDTVRYAPTPVQVVRRLCQLDPEAVVSKSKSGYTPMYALARFGVATKEADARTAQTVDLLAAVSKDPTLLAKTADSALLAEARGGAAVLVSRLIRGYEASDEGENAGFRARAYPLHAACVRHHGQTVRAILRAFPEAAAFRAQLGYEKKPSVAINSPEGRFGLWGDPAPAADAAAAADDATANPPSRDPRLDTPPDTYTDQSPGFPLHMLLRVSEHGDPPDLATFKAVLDAHPDAAKQPAGGGPRRRQPAHVLHALCSQFESPLRLLKCLLKTVPESARIIERGETALHCALDSDAVHHAHPGAPRVPAPTPAAVDVALAVLRAHPGACGVADARGTYPAFLAVKNKWPPAVCVEILRAFPDAGLKKGPRDGLFPLHQATRDGNVETVRAVAEAFPRLARASTEDDGLPLHVAARHSAPDAVTRALLESFPAGARRQDAEGELPLHAVCAALGSDDLMIETSEADAENDRRDYENAKLLYAAFPEGAFHTDASGKIPAERLPMYDIHRMLSRDVFGGDAWRGEGWRVMGGAGDGASQSQSANNASGAALLVRVAANELAVAAMSAPEIERLTVALDRARAAVAKETLRRPFEEALLAEHDRDEKWMCPIGYGLFRDPVRAGDGHVYERSNIVKWQEKSGAVDARPFGLGALNKRAWKSPMTGLSCHDFALAPAAEIRSQIDEKLDEMMRAERGKTRENENGEGAEDAGDDAPPARGSKAKGKAKAAPRAPRGAAVGTGPTRGAKRAAEGAAAPTTRATRAKR